MRIRFMFVVGMCLGLAVQSLAAPAGVPGRLFMQGSDAGVPVILPVDGDRRIRVLDRQIAYRNDRKVCVRFDLPPGLRRSDGPLYLDIEAYNDDRRYLRALWFEVDGIGGYLAVQRISRGQHRGTGTISPGEHKRWHLPLDRLPISLQGKATSVVDLDGVLRQPGPHTICAWISTYAKYGPQSYITLDLVGDRARGFSPLDDGVGSAIPSGGRISSRAETTVPHRQARQKSPDPCAERKLIIQERSLQLALKESPKVTPEELPVCDILEVRPYPAEASRKMVRRFNLNEGMHGMPDYLRDYRFFGYLSHPNLVVLKRAKSLRFYDTVNQRLSGTIAPRECIGEDGRSLNIQRLAALEDGRYLYGEAVSCQPFLIRSDRPERRLPFVEIIGTHALFQDGAGGLLATDIDQTRVYRFASRSGRDARYSLTYFLNDQGMSAYRRGDYARAARWFERAAAVTPKNYLYPHTNLAGALALSGEAEAAYARLRFACTIDPVFTRSRMLNDSDFGGLRPAPQFREILQRDCAVNARREGS